MQESAKLVSMPTTTIMKTGSTTRAPSTTKSSSSSRSRIEIPLRVHSTRTTDSRTDCCRTRGTIGRAWALPPIFLTFTLPIRPTSAVSMSMGTRLEAIKTCNSPPSARVIRHPMAASSTCLDRRIRIALRKLSSGSSHRHDHFQRRRRSRSPVQSTQSAIEPYETITGADFT